MRSAFIEPRDGVITIVLALIGVLAESLSPRTVFPRITGGQQLASGRSGPVSLPWVFREVSNGDRLTVTVAIGWLTPQRWNITPDDSLRSPHIYGQIVPLDTVRPGGLRDWEDGFEMDLSQWLHHGENTLEFTVDNHDGIGGISLRSRPGWGVLLLAASLPPWLLALARLFRLRRSQTLILCLALLVLCFYWAATPWTLRNYDVKHLGETGHLDYVNYVASHAALPRPNPGWEYFQPPLYY
jgi:hypothetical protein